MNRSTSRKRRSSFAVAAVLAATVAFAAAAGPRDVVRHLADEVLVVLRDKSLSSDAKIERIEPIVLHHVDFDTLCRLVLARNWSRLSPEEQKRFQDEFKRHLAVTYGKSVESYRNEDIEITGDREEARGDWTVKSKILRGGGDADVAVDYRLRQLNGEWRIIDFVVEGVSLVANFRSQFQDLLASKSPGELIQLIHDKNQKGEAFPGTKKPPT